MKKLFSSILAVLMIFSCFTFSAFAKDYSVSEGNAMAIAIEDITDAKAGDTVTVNISVKFADGHAGISDGMFTLNYPTDKLELVVDDYENPTTLKWTFPGAMIPSITVREDMPGTVIAGFISMANNATAGNFFELQFKVKEGFTGAAAITFDKDSVDTYFNTSVNYMPEAVGVDLIDGAVNVAVDPVDVTFEAGIAGVADPEAKTDLQPGTEIDLPELPDTDSFRFLGWQIDGEGDVLTGKYTVTADTSFIAAWDEIVYYTVSFNEGDFDDVTVEVNTEIDLPSMDDTANATFAGWSDGEDTYTDKYTVTGDITLTAVWNEIVKYTVTYSEGAEPETVVAGQSVTLPTLTNSELSFKGWKVGDTDEILAGGAVYVPTASVLLTAQWGGGKKVYIDTNGDDANNGLTKDTPVKTLKRVQEIILADVNGENTLDTIVVVEKYEKKNEGTGTNDAATDFLKGVGKKIYITGLTPDSVFDMRWYKADGTAGDSHIRIGTDVEFNNISLYGSSRDGGTMSMGYELTFGENIALVGGSHNIGFLHYNAQYKDNGVVNVLSGTYNRVDIGVQSGQTWKGTATLNIGGTASTRIYNGHGWQSEQAVYGINNVNIDGGNISSISMSTTSDSAITNYSGLRYFTINAGTVGNIATTGSSVSKKYTPTGGTETYKSTSVRAGVTVIEYNGGTVGTIALGTNKQTGELDPDDSTRVVILNNGMTATVEDTGAIVLNVTGAKLHAVTNAYDAEGKPTYGDYTKLNADWGKTITLTGFSYELPEDASFNAVKVGDKIYMLADLTDGLIPAPEAAGAYDVVFTNVFKVTIGEETTLVEEGNTINLERLPQNGELKHIGWATTEGATEATINHTTDYAPTADVTLYPVWAAAVYFTATFESAHGEVPAAISKIDDNEDGVADEAIVFPGYEGKQDEHFTFAGWFDKAYAGAPAPEGAGVPTYNEGDTLVLDGNKTFIAKWTEDAKATVTYVDTAATAPEAVTDYVGEEIEVAAPGTVEGFEFLGWTDGQNVYQAGDKLTIATDVTLTAKWGVKVAVDANGAKGELPVIGGEIGEEIDLPTSVELTYVNRTFVGFALSADGEVITGKYIVNPEDTLYVIWEETVANAAIIETKVVYNSATSDYTVDMYFYGADANTVAFGYAYGENLEFVSFTPAAGLVAAPDALEVNEEGYYSYVVTNQETGKIVAADATAGNGVHLGTITFAYKLAKEEYSEDDAADNIAITAPASVKEYVSSEDYFLYTPAELDLTVNAYPVVFDEAIEYEVVDVVYTVKGSVKVVRKDGTAPKNYAEIEVYNEQGNLYKTFVIEDEATTTVDGVFNYEIGLGAGNYTFVVSKTGYLD